MSVIAVVPASASNTPQLTFSVSTATFDLSAGGTSHFGFWVWCDAGSASSYGDCHGSIYFYSLAPNSVHVTGSAQFAAQPRLPRRGVMHAHEHAASHQWPIQRGDRNLHDPQGAGTALDAIVAVSGA